jgi:hypothetical protein
MWGKLHEEYSTMKFILGKKSSMTQYFAEDGTACAATLIEAGPMTVTQVKDGGPGWRVEGPRFIPRGT